MKTISDNNIIEFYKYLNGDLTADDLEHFIYSHPDLENQLKPETYLRLIALNFKDKHDVAKLQDLIKTQVIEEGQFEKWKLSKALNEFINHPEKTDLNLEKIYDLYCGVYLEDGTRKYEYKFLGNLGLNYLYWTNEGYLKTHHGDNWKIVYDTYRADFEFYHKQLKSFAIELLSAIDNKKIEILNDGTYIISNELKDKMESDEIFRLKHPH